MSTIMELTDMDIAEAKRLANETTSPFIRQELLKYADIMMTIQMQNSLQNGSRNALLDDAMGGSSSALLLPPGAGQPLGLLGGRGIGSDHGVLMKYGGVLDTMSTNAYSDYDAGILQYAAQQRPFPRNQPGNGGLQWGAGLASGGTQWLDQVGGSQSYVGGGLANYGPRGLPLAPMIQETRAIGNLGIQQLTNFYNHFNGPMPTDFKTLDTCSWEQTDSFVKVYVPLRGVHTDLLIPHFTSTSVEVKVVNLQGKNYVFTIRETFHAIVPHECTAVASKTKKNILIIMQKLRNQTADERRWRDYKAVKT